MHILNETLQWLVIAILAYPKAKQFVQDFMEEDDDD